MDERPQPVSAQRAAGAGQQTRLVMVTGHTFGVRAFEGIFSSPAYLSGQIAVPLIIGLDESRAAGTVGYQSPGRLAAEHGCAYVPTTDGRLLSLAAQIRAADPAYILVIGWSSLVPDEILAIPAAGCPAGLAGGGGSLAGQHGCIGMHPTKLPDGRGQAPIPWTIIKGYTQTALSVFFLERDVDSGPVIAQYGLDLSPRETAASLFCRVAQTHFTAGRELAAQLAGRYVRAQRQDGATATRWPRRRPCDGEIRADMTCHQIDALVRGLLGPYPRAFIMADGVKTEIQEARSVDAADLSPGADSAAGAAALKGNELCEIRYPCRDGIVYLRPAGHHSNSMRLESRVFVST